MPSIVSRESGVETICIRGDSVAPRSAIKLLLNRISHRTSTRARLSKVTGPRDGECVHARIPVASDRPYTLRIAIDQVERKGRNSPHSAETLCIRLWDLRCGNLVTKLPPAFGKRREPIMIWPPWVFIIPNCGKHLHIKNRAVSPN